MRPIFRLRGLLLLGLTLSVAFAGAGETLPYWDAKLSPNGRSVELFYGGRRWVTDLYVEVSTGGKRLRTDARDTTLVLAAGTRRGESAFKVVGPTSFEIVFQGSDTGVAVSVRGLPLKPDTRINVGAQINGGPDPLQVRVDGTEDDVQQMASGRAVSGINDCVYDRFSDQALRVLSRTTRFVPIRGGFSVIAGGPMGTAPICRFELVKGVLSRRLPFYAPLDKRKWPKPPAGWCSWYYYFSHVKEQDILRNAQAIAHDYKPFGLEYCLIDAGWQVAGDGENGTPIGGSWTEANSKFPHGMKWMADQIRANGLKPGLWLAVFGNADGKFYDEHRSWFLHDEHGNAKLGTWFGTYVADFSNPELKEFLYKVYRQHTLDWGYDYFKLDGENDTRDIWGENRQRAYDPSLSADEAFRETLKLIRRAMSSKPNVFFSACGPVYPTESMGIAQAARLGGDVVGDKEPPSFRGVRTALEAIRRGYYTHNIAWYGDPDVLVVRPPLTMDEARTWTSMLGLSGQLLMLSDDMAALPEERRDMLRKILPVADISPMELYPAATDRHIWTLHIERPFGSWSVAGLFNWDPDMSENPVTESSDAFSILDSNDRLLGIKRDWGERMALLTDRDKALAENRKYDELAEKPPGLRLLPVPAYLSPPPPRRLVVRFDKIGLDRNRDYLLFDFWNQRFLGRRRGEFSADLPPHACRIISIRPAENHPQLVGTDRHITVGGVELKDEKWDGTHAQLLLKVALVQDYPTTLTIYTAGRVCSELRSSVKAEIKGGEPDGETLRLRLISDRSAVAGLTLKCKP
jgi:hypothetical protein